MACDDLITNQDLENAKKDATTMSDFVESDSPNITSKNGKSIRTLQGINDDADNLISSLGGVDIGDYENDETLNSYNEYVVFDRGGATTGPSLWKAIPPRTPTPGTPLPYTIDSTTYPDPTSDPNIEPFSDINKAGAELIAQEESNAGDSKLTGGSIWPLSSQDSAQVGDDIGSDTVFLGDSVSKRNYKMIPQLTGVLTSVNFTNPPFTAATAGGDCVLVDSSKISDEGFIDPTGAGAAFDFDQGTGTGTDDAPVFQALFDKGVKKWIMPSGATRWASQVTYNLNNLSFTGKGSGKNVEAGGFQTAETQIIADFVAADPEEGVLQNTGTDANCFYGGFSIAYNTNFATPVPAAMCALSHFRGSNNIYYDVKAQFFEGGLKYRGAIYSRMTDCVAENCREGFELLGVGGVSQCNVITLDKCRTKSCVVGFIVPSTTSTTLKDCAAEITSSTYGTHPKYLSGTALIDDNNRNLSIVGNFYVEGADRFMDAPGTNPSSGTTIENFYFRNPANYVVNYTPREFGAMGSAKINAGTIVETGFYSGSGDMLDNVGRILISRNDAQVKGVTGGWVRMNAPDPHTCIIGQNELGVDRFQGVFYQVGSDLTKLYSNLTRKKFFVGNEQYTTNASGYFEVNTGLGANAVGSFIIQGWQTQNPGGNTLTFFEDGTETIRVYVRDSTGSLVASTNVRVTLYCELIENF